MIRLLLPQSAGRLPLSALGSIAEFSLHSKFTPHRIDTTKRNGFTNYCNGSDCALESSIGVLWLEFLLCQNAKCR